MLCWQLSGEPIKELPDKAKIKRSKTRVRRVGKRIVLVARALSVRCMLFDNSEHI